MCSYKLKRWNKIGFYPLMLSMALFILIPCLSFANSTVYVGENTINTASSKSSQTLSKAMKTAASMNQKLEQNSEKSTVSSSSESASPTTSYANNNNVEVGTSVNPQTGQLGLSFSYTLPGVISGIDATIGISNSFPSYDNGNARLLGAPQGWGFDVPFIVNYPYSSNTYRLFSGSGNSVILSSTYTNESGFHTGMLDTPSEAEQLITTNLTSLTLTNQITNQSTTFSYKYLLQSLSGNKLYFGAYGKLLCQEDKYGNFITYQYADMNAYPYQTTLTGITDSYGQQIAIAYPQTGNDTKIVITMPDGKTISYEFNFNNPYQHIITITNLAGLQTTITENFNMPDQTGNMSTVITYPAGGTVTYKYSQCINYTVALGGPTFTFPGVTSVISNPGFNEPATTVTYSYDSVNKNNFTGYGVAAYGSSDDSLMDCEQGVDYNYYSTITTPGATSNYNITNETEYNYLQLPVLSEILCNGTEEAETDYQYVGEDGNSYFPFIQNRSSVYNNTSEVTSTLYPSSSSAMTSVTETNTSTAEPAGYDEFGESLGSTIYPYGLTGGESISTTNSYNSSYSNGTYTGFGILASSTVTGTVPNNTTIESSSNTLASNNLYVGASTGTQNGSSISSSITRDSEGRITQTELTSPLYPKQMEKITISYSLSGSDLTVTTTPYTDNGQTAQASSSSTYDIQNGNLISSTSCMGIKTTYTYTNNNLDLTVNTCSPDGTLQLTTQYNCITPNESQTVYQDGYITQTNSDGFGRVLSQYDNITPTGYGTACTRLLGTTTYNAIGSIESQTDYYGHTTTYQYNDWQGRCTSVTDWQGNTISYDYSTTSYTVDGQSETVPETTIYYNGVEESQTLYGRSGNVLENINFPDSTSEAYTYDAMGNDLTASIYNNSTASGTAVSTGTSTYGFNGLESYQLQTADGTTAKSSWAYDLYNNTTNRTTTYTAVSPSIALGGGTINGETYAYNSLGELVSLTNQSGKTLNFTYYPNGAVETQGDYEGNTYTYTYELIAGSWIPEQTTLTSSSGTVLWTESYTYYDSDTTASDYGSLDTITSTYAGSTTSSKSYTYYGAGPYAGLVDTVTEDGKTMSYTYYPESSQNASPLVESITDYAGITTNFTYYSSAPYGRVETESNSFETVTYTYYGKTTDASNGTVASANQLLWSGDTTASITYISSTTPDSDITVSYEYDGGTTATSSEIIDPLLKTETIYNSSSLILSQTQFTYSGGLLQSQEVSSSVDSSQTANNTTNYFYNDMNELIKAVVIGNDGTTISTTSYVYDIAGNINSKTITLSDGTILAYNYTYDTNNNDITLDQLTNLTETSQSGTSAATTVLNENFSYDPNGNMISITNSSDSSPYVAMTYNALNELTEYSNTQTGVAMGYTYNTEGLRESKFFTNNPSGALDYFYSGGSMTNAEQQSNGEMSSYLGNARYVVNPAAGKDSSAYKSSNGVVQTQYLITDGESVTGTADSSGNIASMSSYTPYGLPQAYVSGKTFKFNFKDSNDLSINNNPIGYDGYYQDLNTGLDYCNARYYMPEIGSFISKDSYLLPNRYAYCGGNPINNVDPSGHNWFAAGFDAAFDDVVAVGGIIVSAAINDPAALNRSIKDLEANNNYEKQCLINWANNVPDPNNADDTATAFVNLGVMVAGSACDAAGAADDSVVTVGGSLDDDSLGVNPIQKNENLGGGFVDKINNADPLAYYKNVRTQLEIKPGLPGGGKSGGGFSCCGLCSKNTYEGGLVNDVQKNNFNNNFLEYKSTEPDYVKGFEDEIVFDFRMQYDRQLRSLAKAYNNITELNNVFDSKLSELRNADRAKPFDHYESEVSENDSPELLKLKKDYGKARDEVDKCISSNEKFTIEKFKIKRDNVVNKMSKNWSQEKATILNNFSTDDQILNQIKNLINDKNNELI